MTGTKLCDPFRPILELSMVHRSRPFLLSRMATTFWSLSWIDSLAFHRSILRLQNRLNIEAFGFDQIHVLAVRSVKRHISIESKAFLLDKKRCIPEDSVFGKHPCCFKPAMHDLQIASLRFRQSISISQFDRVVIVSIDPLISSIDHIMNISIHPIIILTAPIRSDRKCINSIGSRLWRFCSNDTNRYRNSGSNKWREHRLQQDCECAFKCWVQPMTSFLFRSLLVPHVHWILPFLSYRVCCHPNPEKVDPTQHATHPIVESLLLSSPTRKVFPYRNHQTKSETRSNT